MPRRCCERCGLVILGPVVVVEISRLTHRAPECRRLVLCTDCGQAILNYLACRPATLDRLEFTAAGPDDR